jgi:glycosyltransferase involved in cell wall biosynthesis
MKTLHAHNYYPLPGGEDTAFTSEMANLPQHGHEVVVYVKDSRRIEHHNPVSVALQSVWSWETRRRPDDVLRRERPELVHFHNTFPLISPSAYSACGSRLIPIVQPLDNPRLLCPSANFFRNGRLCEDCFGKSSPGPGARYRCHHRFFLQTAMVAALLSIHRWRRTWIREVDAFLVETDSYRRKFIEGVLPADKLFVKPHFLRLDPGYRGANVRGYTLFVGRLDPEKGVRTLVKAWDRLTDIPPKIRGEGRIVPEVQRWIEASGRSNVEIIGRLSRSELAGLLKGARILIWPSEGYHETFGYIAVENFSCRVPVVASRIGVQKKTAADGVTGLRFEPGNGADLAEKAAWTHRVEAAKMGHMAHAECEKNMPTKEIIPC